MKNTEALFSGLNEFWAAELGDILLSRDQLSVGQPLRRGICSLCYCCTVVSSSSELKNFSARLLAVLDLCDIYQSNCLAGTFGHLYKGTVRGLFEDRPRKKLEVSVKALQGTLIQNISCRLLPLLLQYRSASRL